MLICKQNPQRQGKVCESFWPESPFFIPLLLFTLANKNIHSRNTKKKEKEKKNRKLQQSVVGAKTDICRANICVCVGARICLCEGGEGGGQDEIQVLAGSCKPSVGRTTWQPWKASLWARMHAPSNKVTKDVHFLDSKMFKSSFNNLVNTLIP